MADETDVLLKLCEQQWVEAKQAEDQRAAFTNIVVLVSGASFAFIAQMAQKEGLTRECAPLSFLVFVLGFLGAITSLKLYERHQFHIERLRAWRKTLAELHQNAKVLETKDEADSKHNAKYPRLHKCRLHWLWLILHSAIAVTGLVVAIWAWSS